MKITLSWNYWEVVGNSDWSILVQQWVRCLFTIVCHAARAKSVDRGRSWVWAQSREHVPCDPEF